MSLERALAFVLLREGGRVDDPADKGGRTNKGVTQRTYDAWRVDRGLPRRDVWEIVDHEVEEIYRTGYWWVAKDLEWPLSLVAFDSAVLFGPGRAREWLGVVSWRDGPAVGLAWAMLTLRRERHRSNVAKDPSQKRFLAGWMNRLNALADEVSKAARDQRQEE